MTAHPVDGPVMRVAVGGLVDSHCHITASEFDEDREETLQRASAAGVDVIVAVSEGVREAQQLLVFAEAHNAMHKTPRVLVCIGIHPWNVNMEDELADMLALIRQHAAALVGVGEVGLDYMPKTLLGGVSQEDLEARGSEATGEMAASVKHRQQRCLVAQLQLAKELGLPLNVHSCSAGHHTLDLLRDHGAERVLLHAFDGKAHYAEAAARESGYFFSVPPSAIRSPQFQKLVKRLPLRSLLLETDAPCLGPEKGLRNEPANITVALATIAQIKGMGVAETATVLTENARRFWRI